MKIEEMESRILEKEETIRKMSQFNNEMCLSFINQRESILDRSLPNLKMGKMGSNVSNFTSHDNSICNIQGL